jgi:CHAT domain-containing protein/tetratricopeptide (TPR) repeat protein
MSRHLTLWLTLPALGLGLGLAAYGQEFPRTTPEGLRAVAELRDAAVKDGGLERAAAPKSKRSAFVVVDPAKLRRAFSARRDLLSPPTRETLIGMWPSLPQEDSTTHLALMRAAGEVTGDGRLQAFAALFTAAQANAEQRFNVAEREFREAIRRFSELKDLGWEVKARHQQAVFYEGVGKLDEAAAGFRRALELLRTKDGDRDAMIASNLQGLGVVLHQQGKYAEAITALTQAAEILQRREGEMSRGLADTLTSLGGVYWLVGQPARAVGALQRALTIREKLFGPDDLEVAKALDNLGEMHLELAEANKALDLFRRARKVFEKELGEDHPDRAINLAAIGQAAAALERYDEALDCYRRALASMRRVYGPDHAEVASYLSSMADIYSRTGDYGRALEALEQALRIRRARFGDRHRSIAITLSKIGYASARLGRPEVALARYQEALAMLRQIYPENHPEVAANLNNVAAMRSRLDDSRGAIADYRHVLEIYRGVFGERHPNLATVYSNIGAEELKQGQYQAALEDGTRALEIDRAYFGQRHSEVASGLFNLSKIHSSRGDHTRALQAIDGALTALQVDPNEEARPFGRQDADSLKPLPLTLLFLRGRGEQLMRLHGRDLAAEPLREYVRTYDLAATILERIRRLRIDTDIAKVALGEATADVFPRLVHALGRLARLSGQAEAEPLRRAFAAAEQGTARVFLESLGRSRARVVGRVDPSLLGREAELTQRLDALDRAINREQALPLDRRDPQEVGRLLDRRRSLQEDLGKIVAQMERTSPNYVTLMYPRPCTLEQAVACLGPREVALSYILGPEASSLLVLDREGPSGGARISFHELPAEGEIAELVPLLLRPASLEDDSSVRELGARAYRMLLEPAAREIAGKDLVILPGGALGRLPFQLLVEPAGADPGGGARPGPYLVQQHRIRYAPSMTTLHLIRLWEPTRVRPSRPLWAIGDPVYRANDPRLRTTTPSGPAAAVASIRVVARGEPLERLPATGEEVERVRRLLQAGPDEVLTGTAATEPAVRRLSSQGILARYRYIHFACHGVLGSGEGTQPALVLSQLEDPSGGDGFLRLDEITSLRLNSDLVTLSACQTGQGRLYHAEGISGLARAFLYAGSRGVLCSLWKVADRDTSDLIVDVYNGLEQGKSAAEALRAAQLRMIDAEETPFLWAPFVLVGE